MKKTFAMQDLDCANCARKMEDAIRRIPGVVSADVSFMMQKLTIEADDARFDEILQEAARACRRVDADCRLLLK